MGSWSITGLRVKRCPVPLHSRDISQIVTCSSIKHARSVSAFTEQEVAMLSSVLQSPRAVSPLTTPSVG